MSDYPLISANSLRKAAEIQERIEDLRGQLEAILQGKDYKKPGRPGPKPGAKRGAKRKGGSRKISPEGRERIRQAQLKRWAKQKRDPKKK